MSYYKVYIEKGFNFPEFPDKRTNLQGILKCSEIFYQKFVSFDSPLEILEFLMKGSLFLPFVSSSNFCEYLVEWKVENTLPNLTF